MSRTLSMEHWPQPPRLIAQPRVTVLMAVYNGAAYVRQAVESILAQTFRDFEFLIINDGSTDDSRKILSSYDDPRIRILDNYENIGLTRSLNRGLATARGDLIARQDADDVSHSTRLEKQVAFMDARPEIALVGAQARYITEHGQPHSSRIWWKATTPAGIRFQLLFDSAFFHTAVVFRSRIVWERLGGYDETFVTSQDFELWSRLLVSFQASNLSDILIDQRSHPATVSANYSSIDARRVERVLESNLKSFLGVGHCHHDWPALWISVTNPKIAEPFHPSEVFKTIDAIHESFPKHDLPRDAVAEITLQYASKLLLAARLLGGKGRASSMAAILRACRICPPLAARELPRTLVKVLLSQSAKAFSKQESGVRAVTREKHSSDPS